MTELSIPWTRLPLSFDPELLHADLARIPEGAWVAHFNRNDFAGRWSALSLRSRSGKAEVISAAGGLEEFKDTPLMTACPYLRAVVDTFRFSKKSVRLLRLYAHSREHVDSHLGLRDGELRIHVPVRTSELVEFVVANRRLPLREGEAWYVDFSQRHRIHNDGETDRIHLVIDGTLNEWAEMLLLREFRRWSQKLQFRPASCSFRLFRRRSLRIRLSRRNCWP